MMVRNHQIMIDCNIDMKIYRSPFDKLSYTYDDKTVDLSHKTMDEINELLESINVPSPYEYCNAEEMFM